MPTPRAAYLLFLPALFSLGCPESEAQRGQDALKQITAMNRELNGCHRRHAQAFARTPEGAAARNTALWPLNPLSDVEGVLIAKALMKGTLDLEARSAPRDLPANARHYLEGMATLTTLELGILERAEPGDPASTSSRIRTATLTMRQEDLLIIQKYRTALEAR